MSAITFLWHDYETFGISPRRDRPAQFAAIRTDAGLNEIGAPLMLYCRPAPDYLPAPESCLITGITPQLCLEQGLPEHEFAARIEAELALPGTVGVGYNSIRFDDEFTRHLFWRNLIDPYGREWRNGCGRWDLLDVLRLAHALRPEGLVWPRRPDGKPSFRLEDLTRANGIAHEAAHDALSDVRATIALARLLRERQPRLFEFALALRDKRQVLRELGLPALPADARPFLHVSGMFSPERGCLALMWPLAMHPSNRNELLAWDLAQDPGQLPALSSAELRLRLFTPREQLPAGMAPLPLKSIHINKSPMVVANLRTLSHELAAKWGIDVEQALRHAEVARALPDLSGRWGEVFAPRDDSGPVDVEQDLYGGFLGDEDRRRLARLRQCAPNDPAWREAGFDDARLGELVFRYRARNFPETLDQQELLRWQSHCGARLLHGEGGAMSTEALLARLDELQEAAMERDDERAEAILSALYDYADAITPEA